LLRNVSCMISRIICSFTNPLNPISHAYRCTPMNASFYSDGPAGCKAANSAAECSLEDQFFAAVAGSGSSCASDVAMGVYSIPPGCGCSPSRAAPCTYNPETKIPDLTCFMCTAQDLSLGMCPRCKYCLYGCAINSVTEDDYKACLATFSDLDRERCQNQCSKW
jgi:hypothetical protein